MFSVSKTLLISSATVCVVVSPGFVSTSPAFMRNSASHPADLHGHLAKKGYIGLPLLGQEVSTQFAQQLAETTVTASLIDCVVWSPLFIFKWFIQVKIYMLC